MQTFLPYPDYRESAHVLDRKRLSNQRNEAMVILRDRLGIKKGWSNHPATIMWTCYEGSLCEYILAMCTECDNRFIDDDYRIRVQKLQSEWKLNYEKPWWIGGKIHETHRAKLRMRDPWYAQFNWTEPPQPYFWPL